MPATNLSFSFFRVLGASALNLGFWVSQAEGDLDVMGNTVVD